MLMGVEAVYPRKRTTIPGGPSGIYPYKLKGLKIDHPNHLTFLVHHCAIALTAITLVHFGERQVTEFRRAGQRATRIGEQSDLVLVADFLKKLEILIESHR